MKKTFLFLILLIFIISLTIIYKLFPEKITGLIVGGNASVEVSRKFSGEITAIVLEENIEFGKMQEIYVEFTNTGSVNFTEKIEVRVYWNKEVGKLEEVAYYYDSQFKLNPGMRRTFKASFLPQSIGVYYVKARVDYDSKVKEKWKAFLVTYTPPPPPVEIIGAPPAYAPPIVKEVGRPAMSVEYPRSVKIAQGETKLFNISVKNIGKVSLSNLKLYISTVNLIDFEINPKQIFSLIPNESVIFLVSISIPKTTPEGKYPFDFEVVSDSVRESGSIEIEVLSVPPSLKEEVYETILNYEYIISEIQNEIDFAALKGIDIRIPLSTLNKARISLETAKKYYEEEKYEEAREELIKTKQLLEETVLQLAFLSIAIYLPAAFPWHIVFIAISIGIAFLAFLIFLIKRRRKEKRPKLLKGVAETETET